jgi:hypothetical protein
MQSAPIYERFMQYFISFFMLYENKQHIVYEFPAIFLFRQQKTRSRSNMRTEDNEIFIDLISG